MAKSEICNLLLHQKVQTFTSSPTFLPTLSKKQIGNAFVEACASHTSVQASANGKPGPGRHLCLCLPNSNKNPQSNSSCTRFSKATVAARHVQGKTQAVKHGVQGYGGEFPEEPGKPRSLTAEAAEV